MSCSPAVSIIGGVPSGGSASIFALNDVLGELDFAAMANVTLGDGARTFTTTTGVNLAGTIINAAAAGTFDILNGTGWRFNANATNTQYNSGAQSASAWELSLNTLYTAFGIDARLDIGVLIYYSTLTIPSAQTAPAGIGLGLRGVAGTPSNSIARYKGVVRTNAAGTQCMHSITEGTSNSNYTTAPAGTANVLGIKANGSGVSMLGGTWGGSWSMAATPMTIESNTLDTSTATNSGAKDRNNILGISFATGNVNANTVVVIERAIFTAR